VIVPPRRSVTRFFIPLIDVLILLFAIFLLMPFVSGPTSAEISADVKAPAEKTLPTDVKLLQDMLKEEQLRVDRLEKERRARLTDRLAVRVLEIDRTSGVLYYYNPDRQEIRTQADAERYIFQEKKRAASAANGQAKDVFFLILYPRQRGPFPTGPQLDQIRQWFKDVPHGIDMPESQAR
jgi:hypothetical protein